MPKQVEVIASIELTEQAVKLICMMHAEICTLAWCDNCEENVRVCEEFRIENLKDCEACEGLYDVFRQLNEVIFQSIMLTVTTNGTIN